MNRSDRDMAAALDTALLRRRRAMEAADTDTLIRLRRAGFLFSSVAEAIAYQKQAQEAARVQAARIDSIHHFDGRKTA